MKMMKKLFFGLSSILCLGLICGCATIEANARQQIVELTTIEVPTSAQMLFHHFEITSSNGREHSSQYTVFEFSEKPIAFLNDNNFLEEKSPDFEEKFVQGVENLESLEVEDIPGKYQANLNNEYFWLAIADVYFAFFVAEDLLIVLVDDV